MGELSRSRATLRFLGDDLDPDEITTLLGRKPSASGKKGDVVPSSGPLGERTLRSGSWRLRTDECSPGNLEGQIRELLAGTTTDLNVWQYLGQSLKVDIFCGLFMDEWNEGETLNPETLKLLGDRGINLALDIYAPGESRDE